MSTKTREKHTAAWKFQVWAAFGLALTGLTLGVWHLPVDLWTKGYFAMGLVFLTNSCFALAKTLRDDHEAERLLAKLNEAKTEKIIRDFEVQTAA